MTAGGAVDSICFRRRTPSYIQVNIYGETLKNLKSSGMHLSSLLANVGLKDTAVIEVPINWPLEDAEADVMKTSRDTGGNFSDKDEPRSSTPLFGGKPHLKGLSRISSINSEMNETSERSRLISAGQYGGETQDHVENTVFLDTSEDDSIKLHKDNKKSENGESQNVLRISQKTLKPKRRQTIPQRSSIRFCSMEGNKTSPAGISLYAQNWDELITREDFRPARQDPVPVSQLLPRNITRRHTFLPVAHSCSSSRKTKSCKAAVINFSCTGEKSPCKSSIVVKNIREPLLRTISEYCVQKIQRFDTNWQNLKGRKIMKRSASLPSFSDYPVVNGLANPLIEAISSEVNSTCTCLENLQKRTISQDSRSFHSALSQGTHPVQKTPSNAHPVLHVLETVSFERQALDLKQPISIPPIQSWRVSDMRSKSTCAKNVEKQPMSTEFTLDSTCFKAVDDSFALNRRENEFNMETVKQQNSQPFVTEEDLSLRLANGCEKLVDNHLRFVMDYNDDSFVGNSGPTGLHFSHSGKSIDGPPKKTGARTRKRKATLPLDCGEDSAENNDGEELVKKKEIIKDELHTIKCAFPGCDAELNWKVKYGKMKLVNHALLHSTSDDGCLKCRVCSYKGKNSNQMWMHYKRKHPGEKSFGYSIKEIPMCKEEMQTLWTTCYAGWTNMIGGLDKFANGC